MAYQTPCAPLNVTSAWNARPHFSMTRREARCPAATLMIRASGACAQPNRIASQAAATALAVIDGAGAPLPPDNLSPSTASASAPPALKRETAHKESAASGSARAA